MSSAPPLDLDALSLADLKKLVVQLLTRVAVLEEENQRLREEIARLKALPKRPHLAPGSMDKASDRGLAARGLPDAGPIGRGPGGPRRSPRNTLWSLRFRRARTG